MPKTINVVAVKITNWMVDVENYRVIAYYNLLDDTGRVYSRGEAIWYRTLPERGTDEQGRPEPMPDNWYELPQDPIDFGERTYFQVLARLTNDIKSGLAHMIDE